VQFVQQPKRTDRDVEEAIVFYVKKKNLKADEIRVELVKEFGSKRVPSLRTIHYRVADYREAQAQSTWWSLDEAEARVIIDAKAAIAEHGGSPNLMTKEQAEWIIRIKKMTAGLPLLGAWFLARRYAARQERGESTKDLDGLLTYEPWRGGEEALHYGELVRNGHVPEPPNALWAWLDWPLDLERSDPEPDGTEPSTANE
jgi:hypothetical protein